MKKLIVVILALLLLLNIPFTVVLADDIVADHRSDMPESGITFYVALKHYIRPSEYMAEGSVFHGLPIQKIYCFHSPKNEEEIALFEERSKYFMLYLVNVPEDADLGYIVKTLYSDERVETIFFDEYPANPLLRTNEKLKFELSDDGTYYIISTIGSNKTDFVVPEEYNGLPVKGIGIKKAPAGDDSPKGWDNPYFHSGYTLDTITLTDNVYHIATLNMYHNFFIDVKFNDYNGLKYLGTKDNPYYSLVYIPEEAGADIVLHPDTVIIAEKVASEIPLNSIVLSESLVYIPHKAFLCNYVFDGTAVNPMTHDAEYNIYKGLKYFGTPENPYYALVGIANPNITQAEIHKDTKLICPQFYYEGPSRITADKVENVTIPKSVISISEDAFYLFPSLKEINFEAKGKDEFKVCDVVNTLSEDINVNWGYVPTEPTPTEPTADESNNIGAFVWVGIGAIVAGAVIFLIIKKSKQLFCSSKA